MEAVLGLEAITLQSTAMSQTRLASRVVRASDRPIAMEIAFENKSLRKLCESERTARRSLGARVAERLKRRLADLRAANCVQDVVAGRPRELHGNSAGQVVLDLGEGAYLVFCTNHSVAPLSDGTHVDWSKVNRVKIISIENNHV
jgi:plasmid maintenance system killer protein